MAFRWGPMMARIFSGIMNPSSLFQLKNNKKVRVGPPLTKLSGSAHGHDQATTLFYNESIIQAKAI